MQVVSLLGAPRVVRDGAVLPAPRGHKPWALLAQVLLSGGPVPRTRLCTLLFADAEDPGAALRWNLSALRRALDGALEVAGDPLVATVPPGTVVDVLAVLGGTWDQVQAAGGCTGELLEQLSFPACPSFEVWLEAQRRRLRGAAAAVLREQALTRLVGGDPRGAADLAAELVLLDPLDENAHALLVRALATAGNGVGAARQVAACRALLRRELGVEPGPALAAAAATSTARPVAHAQPGRAGVTAQLEAGQAALSAGAVDAGLDCLRRAVADAGPVGDPELQARALVALGTALVHAVRGGDEEGATALHRALAVVGDRSPALTAEASRELAHVEFLRGRYDRVEGLLRAAEAAAPDDALRARVLTVRGSALTDVGRYGEAEAALRSALALGGDDRPRAYALAMLGRLHLLREELDAAATRLDASCELAARSGWTAFSPWPASLRAEVDLRQGRTDAAAERLEHAFALSCHLGDPCWEGVSGRGLGRLHAARHDVAAAVQALEDARARCTRLPDGYLWLDAWTLDALAGLGVEHGLPQAAAWAEELVATASARGMRELAVRGLLHRAATGVPAAREAAEQMAAEVDNPALHRLLGALTPAGS